VSISGLRAQLEDAVSRASVADLPTLVGELERAKALAYGKLMSTHHGTLSDYLTVAEVVVRLRLSRARVYELIRAGALPAVRMGRRGLRIRAGDLARWEQRPTIPVDTVISRVLNHSCVRQRP
jgi:excisionase family DNA binding protein